MILLYPFSFLNLIAFILIGYDKKQAKKNTRRISEKTLLTLVLIGGSIGSGLGMIFFRHKTAKKSYLWKFWGIVLFQIVVFFCITKFIKMYFK